MVITSEFSDHAGVEPEIHAKAMMQQLESIRMVWGGLYWLMDTP